MPAESRSVVVRLSAETAAYIRDMQAAGKLGEDAMQRVERATDRADQAQTKISKTARMMGLAVGAALVYTTKAAVDWESQWAGVEKTVDGTAKQMGVLEGQLRDLATTMPATHQEIAATAEAAGQLGVAREDISSFTSTMVQLGETTNLTADQAATDIAQIQNVMSTAAGDIDNFGAALVALGNNGASTEAQILGMTQRIAAAGSQIGLTEADILGIANAAASMGIEVEAGGSAISRVFTEIAKATAQGGDDLQTFAEVAGMSSAEFTKAFEDDPARAFASFTQGLDRINKSGGDVFTVLDKLKLSDVRVSQALLSMAASGDYLTKSLDLSAQAWDENSALANEFAKRMDTDAAQVQIAINNVRDAAIDFGATMLPIVEDIAQGVTTVSNALESLPDPIQSVITRAVALSLVIGGAAWFGTKTIAGVKTMRTELTALGLTADTTKAKLASISTVTAAAALGIDSFISTLSQMDSMNRSADAAKATASSIEDLTDALSYSNVGKYADDLHINLGRLADDLITNGENGEYATKVMNQLTEASHGFGAMVNAEASHILPFWEGSAEKAYDARKDLKAIIENNTEALGQGTAATQASTSAIQSETSATASLTSTIEANVAAMEKAREARLRAANAEINWHSALLDANDAVKQNGRTLASNTREGLANQQALVDLAGAWNGLSEQAQDAPGAYRKAINAFVDVAVQMGMNRKAARDYAKSLFDIPPKIVTEATFDAQGAAAGVQRFNRELASIDRHIDVFIQAHTSRIPNVGGMGPQLDYASGGYTGPGGKYDIAGVVHRGEVVIPQEYVARDWNMLKARYGNLPGFADGGYAGPKAMSSDLADRERLFGIRQRIAIGPDNHLRAMVQLQQQTNQQLNRVVGRVGALEAAIDRNAETTGRLVAGGINGAVETGLSRGAP